MRGLTVVICIAGGAILRGLHPGQMEFLVSAADHQAHVVRDRGYQNRNGGVQGFGVQGVPILPPNIMRHPSQLPDLHSSAHRVVISDCACHIPRNRRRIKVTPARDIRCPAEIVAGDCTLESTGRRQTRRIILELRWDVVSQNVEVSLHHSHQ